MVEYDVVCGAWSLDSDCYPVSVGGQDTTPTVARTYGDVLNENVVGLYAQGSSGQGDPWMGGSLACDREVWGFYPQSAAQFYLTAYLEDARAWATIIDTCAQGPLAGVVQPSDPYDVRVEGTTMSSTAGVGVDAESLHIGNDRRSALVLRALLVVFVEFFRCQMRWCLITGPSRVQSGSE
jgi:hypothetical protein